ncbi:hypothetical protein OG21DRAFT_1524723 [Imleria badia]|nr:hypothetical protein OG21DRAFT_1524723 [Imleria badia]
MYTMSAEEFFIQLTKMFMPATHCCQAEKELHSLKQGKGTIEDFMVQMKQLALKAKYDFHSHSHMLIFKFVERSKPDLMDKDNFAAWEEALVQKVAGSSQWPQSQGRASMTTTPAATTLTTTMVGVPSQASTFGGQGVPMDISKARAEGKCFKCGQPWPCKEHFKPHQRQACTMVFQGVTIEYTNADGLMEAIKKVENEMGFPTGQ